MPTRLLPRLLNIQLQASYVPFSSLNNVLYSTRAIYLQIQIEFIFSFKSSPKPLCALILYYVKTTTIKMANKPKSLLITTSIITLVREQLTIMQQSFIEALAQQRAALEAQYQQLIEALRKELYNVKAPILQTLIITPINEINITVSKPGPLNKKIELVIVA